MTDKAKEAEPKAAAMNIYQKIAAITGEVGAIKKAGQNREQNYSFIEYAAVAGELRTLFAKYGVVIIPNMQKTSEQSRNDFTTRAGKGGVAVLIDFKFDIVNADKPDDRFSVDWVGEAVDYGDKATNKAATAALKYYLMRQFNISEKGEQEADAHTPERPAYNPAPEPTPPTPAPVRLITQEQIDTIAEMLDGKGMTDEADQKALVLKMAKKTTVQAVPRDFADALIARIRPAEPSALFAAIGQEIADEPVVDDDIDQTPGTEPENSPSGIDYPPDDEPDDGDEPDDENERPLTTKPPQAVDDEFKASVRNALDVLGLKPQERMRLLKDTTGAVTDKNLTAQQWRDFSAAIDDRAIDIADAVTGAETPQLTQTSIEGGHATNNQATDTQAV